MRTANARSAGHGSTGPEASAGRSHATLQAEAGSEEGVWLEALGWLEDTWVAEFVRVTPWVYSSLEVAHLLGLALLVGPAALFDLRLLGAGRGAVSVVAAARHLLPVARAGFAATGLSGAAMFAAGAREVAGTGAAPVKLVLLMVAGLNIALFHLGVYRRVHVWDDARRTPAKARVAGAISLVTWTGVVACGRLIAYT
ncbi:hypothetical protein [Nonomuraea sp. CA-141351]|uniref:hypothetical protein n=1 Tax=Nonomuraea sp. CA-141351 TaxID=3239996 RepID=UPI003D8D39FE